MELCLKERNAKGKKVDKGKGRVLRECKAIRASVSQSVCV